MIADDGYIYFGDENGYVTMTDGFLNLSWKYKIFNNEINGIAYICDTTNKKKNYIYILGNDDTKSNIEMHNEIESQSIKTYQYFIKVMLKFIAIINVN